MTHTSPDPLQRELQFLNTIVDTIASLVIVLDLEGRIVRFNRACERLTGYQFSEVEGRAFWDFLLPPEDAQPVKEAFASLRSGQFPNQYENDWVMKDGTRRRIAWLNNTILSPGGLPEYIIGTGMDITQLRTARAALQESEQRYNALFHNRHTVMLLIDPQTGDIVDANPAAVEFYGYPAEKLKSMQITQINQLPFDQVHAAMQRALAGSASHYQFRHRLASGEIRDVDVFTGPITSSSRPMLYSIIHDITERKRAEDLAESLSRFPNENPHPVMRISVDGVVLYGNRACEPILATWGCRQGEAIPSEWRETVRSVDALGESREVEIVCKGSFYACTLQPVEGESYVNLYGRDVTIQRKIEEERLRLLSELEAERSLWKATVESMLDPVTISDASGRATYMNSIYTSLIARTIQSDLPLEEHSSHYAIYHPDGALFDPRDLPLQRAALEDEQVRNVELIQLSPGGEARVFIWNAAPLHDSAGKLMGAVAVGHDITEQRRLEKDLEKNLAALQLYASKLEQVNREMQDFTFIASHDLQEPLRKIQGFGNRLADVIDLSDNPPAADYLDRMIKAAGRMQRMITDLLAYSRITTHTNPFDPIDLNEVARQAISDLELRIEQTDGQVLLNDLPTIAADPQQMQQLFLNLIGNALKYHKPNVPPVVQVYAGEHLIPSPPAPQVPGSVTLIFQDNGIGFDPLFTERIFQPFQRLHTRSEYEGTGIGLSICRKIVERHGGRITARSTPGEGSSFIVTMPVSHAVE